MNYRDWVWEQADALDERLSDDVVWQPHHIAFLKRWAQAQYARLHPDDRAGLASLQTAQEAWSRDVG